MSPVLDLNPTWAKPRVIKAGGVHTVCVQKHPPRFTAIFSIQIRGFGYLGWQGCARFP